jgi:gamma-glutamyltranspeptidase/glutathione hydrolase
MSPIIVFDAETSAPVLAIGSPGGPRIIGYVARALVAVLDHGLKPSEAIARPHVLYGWGKAEVEDIGWPSRAERDALVKALEAKGHTVSVTQENSGVHAVSFSDGQLVPGIDPRRDGAARGE